MALVGKLFRLRTSINTRRICSLQFTSAPVLSFLVNGKIAIAKPTTSGHMEMECSGEMEFSSVLRIANEKPKKKIISPPIRKGMQTLDRAAFTIEFQIPSFVLPEEDFRRLLKPLKPYLLKIKKIQPTISELLEGTQQRRILLNPDVVPDVSDFLRSFPKGQISEQVIDSASSYPLTLTYDHWGHDQITNSILPDDQDKFGGFTQTGSVIQVNLRDHLLPFKNIIGEILLDKIPNTKTVVNKVKSIDNEFRNFQMEVVAGEPNTVVRLKENHCEYEFDFATVYWNSRLSSEHERIVKKYLQAGDVLFDVFAGIGPFAVPAAKKQCHVFANDLNPESAKWLKRNTVINKVTERVEVFNKDGREFIRQDVASLLRKEFASESRLKSTTYHVTMNLPAIAVEFLDSFWNLFENMEDTEMKIPSDFKLVVHVYCFIKDTEGFKEKALALVKEKLLYPELPDENVMDVAFVRTVAPNKEMFRVSFIVPHIILTSALPPVVFGTKRKISELDDDDS